MTQFYGLDKIDNKAVDGLLGVNNSLGYRIHEIERHFHGYESWFGAAAVPAGTTNVGDRIAKGITHYEIDAANDDWGAWTCILGSLDTPARGTSAKFDIHRLFVTDCERTTHIHFVQMAFGAVAADAYTAGDFTEIVWKPGGTTNNEAPMDVMSRRQNAGTLVWARVHVPGQNTGYLRFFLGMHEYEG
jgi:hypothetical protein